MPKEWADKYKGKFDDGWDAYREKAFARQKELGIIPQDTELSRHDPDVQDWNKLSADESKLYARMMEVFAGFLEHTDHHIGRLIDFLAEMGELDNTLIMFISDNGASAEGGPNGSVNENKFFNNVPDDLQQNLAALDELGGPEYFNHYSWGWTFAGNTPFRRWKRETYRGGVVRSVHRPLAQGHQGQGRDPHPVRARHRHGADRARRAGHRGPGAHQGRDAVADRGRQLRSHLQQRQGAEQASHPILRNDGPPLDLSRWLARGVPVAGTVVHRGQGVFRRADLDRGKLSELDAKGWELYNMVDDSAENNNLAATNRDKLIEMIALWYVEAGKYNVLPIDSRGTARFADARPQLAKDRDELRLLSRHPDGAGKRRRQGAEPRAQHHRRGRDSQRAAPKACWSATAAMPAATRLFVKDSKLHYVHNYVGSQEFHVESNEPRAGRQSHKLRFEFELTGKPDIAKGKGAPGRGAALHRRQARRPGGAAGNGAAAPRARRRSHGRPQSRLSRVAALPTAIPVHRHDLQGHRGRLGTDAQDTEEERKAAAKAAVARQ